MDYVLVEFDGGQRAYQESNAGHVVRYLDESGAFLFAQPPIGIGCAVIDAAPPRLDWMLPVPDPAPGA